MGRRVLPSILLGGLVAGICDITYAIVISYVRRGVSPLLVLQSVASGWLGKDAFQGGIPTGILGLVTHFGIALTAAAVYVFASQRLPVLVRKPLATGAAYGALVFAFMNLVVIPLSRTPPRTTFSWVVITTGLLVHIFLIGVPIAFAARRGEANEYRG